MKRSSVLMVTTVILVAAAAAANSAGYAADESVPPARPAAYAGELRVTEGDKIFNLFRCNALPVFYRGAVASPNLRAKPHGSA